MANSTRINITLDDELKTQSMQAAKELGLSFSGLVRLLLAKTVKKKLSGVEQGLLDYINGDVETISLDDFEKEIQAMMKNA